MLNVLHIMPRLSGAGPDRALFADLSLARDKGLRETHSLVSLEQTTSQLPLMRARALGLSVHQCPDQDTIRELVGQSDLVQIHFWNCPSMTAFLSRDLPPCRTLLWAWVFGASPPQILPEALFDCVDYALVTSDGTLDLPSVAAVRKAHPERVRSILGLADMSRLDDFKPIPHDSFTVGYLGLLNFAKLHPDILSLCQAVSARSCRFLFCGGGLDPDFEAAVKQTEGRHSFEIWPYRDHIASVLGQMDVFGYPLCPETYATSEKALQEAMWCGIPPVVLAVGGFPWLVEHGVTGFIARDADEYPGYIDRLASDTDLRKNIGRNARDYARSFFDPEKSFARFRDLIGQMLLQEKTIKTGCLPADPVERFLSFLGPQEAHFRQSTREQNTPETRTALNEVKQSSYLLRKGEGGVFHYRNAYPEQAVFRFWSGLLLQEEGKLDAAEKELDVAAASGLTLKES